MVEQIYLDNCIVHLDTTKTFNFNLNTLSGYNIITRIN